MGLGYHVIMIREEAPRDQPPPSLLCEIKGSLLQTVESDSIIKNIPLVQRRSSDNEYLARLKSVFRTMMPVRAFHFTLLFRPKRMNGRKLQEFSGRRVESHRHWSQTWSAEPWFSPGGQQACLLGHQNPEASFL